MRLRRNPKAIPFLMENPLVVKDPEQWRGKWQTLFPNPQPLFVELGTGKGQFLAKAASLHPDKNWIGVERVEEVLLKAVQKGEATECTNIRYLWIDVKKLPEIFAPGEVSRFFLHFSDPWPKKRHTKRRLTYRVFLNMYKDILAPDGDLILKTDSEGLYTFSLEEFTEMGWEIVEQTTDLHHSPYNEHNITTEYEDKFVSQGMPIYYVRVKPPRPSSNPSLTFHSNQV
ncbi:tRNA (guanosine(46)-N7)-methyltransferase TrmB [Thermoflavimicrobium dichotomicum]|uniref:tRNA (guanine-N(7)-)-methyltransferase n=1 Tax=Thermoflavimicrobium dichotomicum TaxID=46223 RepID=A0A1I3MKJ9_9BACL|nr:tRNA (guanosine(46)-N7)-methyltransferase TrmB [Thermoflavimicrobium dichotomicum]SFI97664.1 tRNA (guanine-N7-)-methyltransferase [Thermoflavimicrobium dichotomicum]